MHIVLPPDLAALVERLRATGQFESDDEIVRVALVDLDRRAKAWAQKHAELKTAIAEGLDGPFEEWDVEDAISRLNAEADQDRDFAKAAE